ncbi:SAM-dependent methyltransferase [Fontibacillus solani]|uniref:SAM-dependent methyltransferase n=1 Tax=Fontibacillus solani TaxID=1572857 RepID=A0A7W3SRN1_9BACL|nr:class I SAM-dependent methyltransferase [Fontibacillus solani]MBA9084970.1 SAM-dependent methyltransferase [Fontibacillus solani]
MGFPSVLSFAHKLISERLQPGDIAIDATAGTGADTLFLAKTCGRRGHVYAFDIQRKALELTRSRLDREMENQIEGKTEKQTGHLAYVTLLEQSHSEMEEAIPSELKGKVGAIMFNLGYLPSEGADHSLITQTDSTLVALHSAITLLRPRGIVTAVLYPGHSGGDSEASAVEAWAAALPSALGQALIYRQLQKPEAPYLIAIEKK